MNIFKDKSWHKTSKNKLCEFPIVGLPFNLIAVYSESSLRSYSPHPSKMFLSKSKSNLFNALEKKAELLAICCLNTSGRKRPVILWCAVGRGSRWQCNSKNVPILGPQGPAFVVTGPGLYFNPRLGLGARWKGTSLKKITVHTRMKGLSTYWLGSHFSEKLGIQLNVSLIPF